MKKVRKYLQIIALTHTVKKYLQTVEVKVLFRLHFFVYKKLNYVTLKTGAFSLI